jgi:hypothetical protein
MAALMNVNNIELDLSKIDEIKALYYKGKSNNTLSPLLLELMIILMNPLSE